MSVSQLSGQVVDAGDCPYLPGRRFHAFQPVDAVDGGLYRILLDNRFRRAGGVVYAPVCPDCTACQPIRVPVAAFRPRRDQRRCLTRNADLTLSWWPRGVDDERSDLWHRYQQAIHDDPADRDPASFLVEDGGIPGGELQARDKAGRLLAVAICDVVGDAWSSVYCYWEPSERERGLGTFLALAEIAEAARRGCSWWYPGFWVRGCAKMAYKIRYQPYQVLVDGQWR